MERNTDNQPTPEPTVQPDPKVTPMSAREFFDGLYKPGPVLLPFLPTSRIFEFADSFARYFAALDAAEGKKG
jgi:hypothetical protein